MLFVQEKRGSHRSRGGLRKSDRRSIGDDQIGHSFSR